MPAGAGVVLAAGALGGALLNPLLPGRRLPGKVLLGLGAALGQAQPGC
jgi:hypothetical protein